jgi:hypothetical protein
MSDYLKLNDHLRLPDARCKLLAVTSHAQNFNSAHGNVNTSLNHDIGPEPIRDYLAKTRPAT